MQVDAWGEQESTGTFKLKWIGLSPPSGFNGFDVLCIFFFRTWDLVCSLDLDRWRDSGERIISELVLGSVIEDDYYNAFEV